MDNLWVLHPELYNSIINESRKLVLHPKIAELITQNKDVKILDYGCGDGAFIKTLNPDVDVSLYDVSNVALSIAKKNLKEFNPTILYDVASIPDDYFDFIVFSLVVMTLQSKREIKETFEKIHSSLNKTGKAIVAMTHPCFRQEVFSTFQTAYSKDKKFNYFKEGDKFEVVLRDSETSNIVTFYDYHWTLSTVLNLISDCGLVISAVNELKDLSQNNKYFNSRFSPYIIIVCNKRLD
jgi:ubiquinone/menaquinone biosynthesis C-methylase UbiE